MKNVNVVKKINFFYATLFLFICSCSESKITETQRVPNNNNSLDAVVAIKETGATVATPTEVYIVKTGSKLSTNPIFRADNVEGLKLVWEDETKLTIQAEKARVFLQESSVKIIAKDEHEKLVTIQLAIQEMK